MNMAPQTSEGLSRRTLESSIAHLQSANSENDDLIRVVALLKSKI